MQKLGLLKGPPKKRDLSLPGNYREIIHIEVAYKVIAKISEYDPYLNQLMWVVLEKFGVPDKLLHILRALYEKIRAHL